MALAKDGLVHLFGLQFTAATCWAICFGPH
jgi:hypothetical protein